MLINTNIDMKKININIKSVDLKKVKEVVTSSIFLSSGAIFLALVASIVIINLSVNAKTLKSELQHEKAIVVSLNDKLAEVGAEKYSVSKELSKVKLELRQRIVYDSLKVIVEEKSNYTILGMWGYVHDTRFDGEEHHTYFLSYVDGELRSYRFSRFPSTRIINRYVYTYMTASSIGARERNLRHREKDETVISTESVMEYYDVIGGFEEICSKVQ